MNTELRCAARNAASGKTALGYAEATDLFSTFPATFAGQQVDNTSILVKYTFYGDSNFDGQTNLSDFNVLAANFGTSNKRWVRGDNDYNLTVNLSDFNRLAGSFGLSGLGPDASFQSRKGSTSSVINLLDSSEEAA